MVKIIPINMICAMDLSQGIGFNQNLPWHLPEDLAHFRVLTTQARPLSQNAVIMGRKTWESLPNSVRPLPNRFNVVLTHSDIDLPSNALKADSIDTALTQLASKADIDSIFIIGGGRVYQECILRAEVQTLYLTIVENIFDCDTFFPEYKSNFNRFSITPSRLSKSGIGYHFESWKRKDS
jgi:dihydrofolate reductase